MSDSLFRRRKPLVVAGSILGVAAMTLGLSVPAGATPAPAANNTLIGAGSNTAYTTMQQISDLFNSAPGCNLLNTATQELNFSCASSPQTGDENGYQVGLGDAAPLNYSSVNPYDDVSFEEPAMGSSNGIAQLEDNGTAGSGVSAAPISYARSSRAPKSTDLGLEFVAYADDAVPWFHFTKVNGKKTASAKISNLSEEQLQDIYDCTAANVATCGNWSDYGGSKAPIDCYMAQNGSGTESTWATDITGGSATPACLSDGNDGSSGTSTHVIFENEDSSIIANGDAADAIFFFSYGKFSLLCPKGGGACDGGNKKNVTAIGEINSITANKTTIQCQDVSGCTGAYPTDRRLYNVYENGSSNNTDSIPVASQATLNLVSSAGFLCNAQTYSDVDPLSPTGATYGTEIQDIITANGFFPIPEGTENDGVTTGTVTPWTSSSSSSEAQITDNTVSNNPLSTTNPYYEADVAPSAAPANNGDTGYCRVFEGS